LILIPLLAAAVGCSVAPANPTPSASPVTASPASIVPGGSAPDRTESAVDPTAVPLPTTSTGWSRVPAQASVAGVQLQRIIWTGARFVGIGVARDADGTAILDSPDGVTWSRQAAFGANQLPAALAAGPHGVLAVLAGDDHVAAWSSPDGLTWTVREDAFPGPTADGASGGPIRFIVRDIVATETGWLAVGRVDPVCQLDCGTDPVRPLVWTSRDGSTWTAQDEVGEPRGGMNAVARTGDGFVAVGLGRSRAAVWMSGDGSTWSPVADAPLLHALPGADPSSWVEMIGVAAADGVIVAVGMDGPQGGGDNSIRAWWSRDGRLWSDAPGESFAGGQAFAVTATPAGFLLAGPPVTTRCLGGMWESADGRSWTCVASDAAFAGFGPYAVASSPALVVAVGLDSSGPDSDDGVPGTVWIKRIG